jgi:hypothetical protein
LKVMVGMLVSLAMGGFRLHEHRHSNALARLT